MAAETKEKKKTFFRKPDCALWTGTFIVTMSAVWCLVVLILTASGHFLDSHNFECLDGNENFVASRLKSEARLVYLWAGLNLPVCILLLSEIWRRKGYFITVLLISTIILFVVMIATFMVLRNEEAQEIEEFEKRYLRLLPLIHAQRDTDTFCNDLSNVYRWQAEFKCCGLQSFQDWMPPIPYSCFCDREGNSTGCVGVEDNLVYEKPCLPIVLSLAQKRSSTFWIVMISWITYAGAPVAFYGLCLMGCLLLFCYSGIFEPCYDKLNYWIYKMRGGEDMFPVVFIRKDNNNQTEEDNGKDGEAEERGRDENAVLDIDVGKNVEGEGRDAMVDDRDDNPVRIIPLSQLKRLQEGLDPPPVQHKVRCMCIDPGKPKVFYTILIDEGSPLLPEGAVMVDANKPSRRGLWVEGPHVINVQHLIWPERKNSDFHSNSVV